MEGPCSRVQRPPGKNLAPRRAAQPRAHASLLPGCVCAWACGMLCALMFVCAWACGMPCSPRLMYAWACGMPCSPRLMYAWACGMLCL